VQIRPLMVANRGGNRTSLIWHLSGNRVVALTADTAAIESRTTGNILIYRRARQPALGPVGDCLDDLIG